MSAAAPEPRVGPQEVWQRIYAPGTFPIGHDREYSDAFPASLPDGRQIVLPLRVLPEDQTTAVASLIVHQASFEVEDALMDMMARDLGPHSVDTIVAVPSLGLTLASGVARRLGHRRMAALGTTRKFWYEDALSEPSSSISSRSAPKTLYLDPRLRPLLEGRRVAVVDDVISTGSSLSAVLRLLARISVEPVAIAAAMLQSSRWRTALREEAGFRGAVHGVFATPLFTRGPRGGWLAAPESERLARHWRHSLPSTDECASARSTYTIP